MHRRVLHGLMRSELERAARVPLTLQGRNVCWGTPQMSEFINLLSQRQAPNRFVASINIENASIFSVIIYSVIYLIDFSMSRVFICCMSSVSVFSMSNVLVFSMFSVSFFSMSCVQF